MDLVHDHVLEALVVDGAEIDVGLHGFTCDAGDEDLFAQVVVAVLGERNG